MVNLICL